MYDELVKRLRCLKYGSCPDCPMWYSEEVEPNLWRERCAAIDAADAIEERCQQVDKFAEEAARLYAKQPRWIPVTERLPGREWVLCKCRVKIHEVLSLRDGYWYHDPQHQYMSGFVTHWMPLPKPPKEG